MNQPPRHVRACGYPRLSTSNALGMIMRPRRKVILLMLIMTCAGLMSARADEQMTPLAEQGNWVAMQHSSSITDPPDMCLAASLDGLAFRTDETDTEIRLVNDKWSLPANVTGSLTLKVNGKTYTFDITGNQDRSIAATISVDQLQSIVADMNKASSMIVIAGSATPITVSLDGSNAVISAYLTCANISPPSGETPAGANPFASPPVSQ
jgi:hypothetical protein